jgi:hypothetical protein
MEKDNGSSPSGKGAWPAFAGLELENRETANTLYGNESAGAHGTRCRRATEILSLQRFYARIFVMFAFFYMIW